MKHSASWFFHGPEGIRTLGLCVANAALSQLSYEPISQKSHKNGGNGARTHDLSRVRRTLSRLSYVSMTIILPHFSDLTRGKFIKMEKCIFTDS